MTARALLAGVLAACGFVPAIAAPDALRGEQVYNRCLACHALAYDRVGPRHCGLFGRLAGSVPGYEYSPAMKSSKTTWGAKTRLAAAGVTAPTAPQGTPRGTANPDFTD